MEQVRQDNLAQRHLVANLKTEVRSGKALFSQTSCPYFILTRCSVTNMKAAFFFVNLTPKIRRSGYLCGSKRVIQPPNQAYFFQISMQICYEAFISLSRSQGNKTHGATGAIALVVIGTSTFTISVTMPFWGLLFPYYSKKTLVAHCLR